MKKNKSIKLIILPIFIITIIFLINYKVKQIYPFGSNTVAQGDMANFIHTITFFKDSILDKSLSSLFFTPLISSGFRNSANIFWLNPFFVIYLFSNSNKLLFNMSFIIILKCILCYVTSYICLNKIFGKDNIKYNVIFSFEYALSSYILINYSTLYWIDIIILFPLLIIGLIQIFKEKKILLYSVVLGLCVLESYQIVYMILIAIVILTLIRFKIFKNKNQKQILLCLGIGTLVGVLFPTIFTIFVLKTYTTSYRFSMRKYIYNRILFCYKTFIYFILFNNILFYNKINKIYKKRFEY